ncbi:CxC2 domain-containing protein [Mycena indigotica]|uniref:CxC2 domain-containing protein n=1 Tax=Mycena indigotica TaxID=2126181 RepID=A0A8H6SUA9_9AGAR|nr:CxC2 domain-containing protein [Mycena indigotica]KAF7306305.1 CxC2 domain-containing protein [Mycena indigotica]
MLPFPPLSIASPTTIDVSILKPFSFPLPLLSNAPRLSYLERQQPVVPLPGEEPERYEMAQDPHTPTNDAPSASARASQPADKAMHDWAHNFRDKFIQGMLWRDGRGRLSSSCGLCGGNSEDAIYRCEVCYGDCMLCQECCVKTHATNPTHFIQKWTGVYFIRTSLRDLGLQIHFGHPLGQLCPLPRIGPADFVIIADNGIHEVAIDFCGLAIILRRQHPLERALLLLALIGFITCHCVPKTTPYDFYSTLESLTDGTGIKPPDRYSVFMRISRQYRHLLLLKRMGRGHDTYGVMGTGSGELALRCPACPRPGVNLPEGWENAPPEDQCLYIMFIAIDACFRLKRRAISNELRDPGLGTGWAYMLEWQPYREYLSTVTDQQEMSTCSGLAALDHANSKFSRGYSVTGVGMGVCARHEFVLPNGVGDLQAGERYSNMDYIFASFMRHLDSRLRKLISYDIVCQWMKYLLERLAKLPSMVRLSLALMMVRFAIPKMHIKGHLLLCQIFFSLLLILGSGMTDGEGIERPWSMIGGIAASTRVCGPGSRWDQLDDHWSFWNWLKTLGLALLLRRRMDRAIEECEKQEQDFETLTLGHADRALQWKQQVDEFEADNSKPNPYESKSEGMTENAVRKMFEEEEAEQEKAGLIPIHDVSPTEFIVALLDAEADQRRIRGLVDLKKTRGTSGGISLRRQRRKLNRAIKRLRTLQSTYTPAALRALEALKLPQDTFAERVPLLPPSAISRLERGNGGCRDGLIDIERALREAQCRSALTSLQLQLHVKARLLTYKRNNSRAQAMNTRSRTLVDQNERKILLHSEKYQNAWRALVALEGDEKSVSWRKLEKGDIRCMEEPEEVQRDYQKRQKAERAQKARDAELLRAGLPVLPTSIFPMDNEDMEADEDEDEIEGISIDRSNRQDVAREANAFFKHGESRRHISWIWSNTADTSEAVEEALRIEWAKSYARMRRWKEEVRILAAEAGRIPLSFAAEENAWIERAKKINVSELGGEQAEGAIAYATKHADLYRNLARRAEATMTRPKVARGKKGQREVFEIYTAVGADVMLDERVDTDDEDEHGNASDEDEDYA